MGQPEKYRPSVQEIISPDQTTSVDMLQIKERKPEEVFGELETIKKEYDSWLPEDHHGVTFYQAICICLNNCTSSNLVKRDPDKFKQVKNSVFQILDDNEFTLPKLHYSCFVTGYDYDILKLFDNNPNLKKSFLKETLELNNGSENHQLRRKLVLEYIESKKDKHQKPVKTETNPNQETDVLISTKTSLNPNQETTPDQPVEETPNTEIIPFGKRTFSEKFKTIKDLKDEYSKGGKNNTEIPFLTAIKLIHPEYKEEESLQHASDTIKSLERWFQLYLTNFGIDDVGNFDYELFSSFSNANPNIISLFDDYDSEGKLGETTFRAITTELSGYHRKLQLFISGFLLTIPLKQRPDINKTKDFVKRCKIGFDFDANNTVQKKRIIDIYTDFINGVPEQPILKQSTLTQLTQERFPQTTGHYLEQKPSTLHRTTTVKKTEAFSLPETRIYKTPKGIEPLKPKQNIVTLDSKPIQTKIVPEQPVFIPEILEVRILKWWTNPECKLKPIEQDVMTEIYSGTNLFEIIKKTSLTSKQIHSIYEKACSRKLFIDSKYSN